MGTGYILKQGSSGLLSVRLTDAGRKKLSQGQLTLSLFQLGDSEMCYDCYTDVLNQTPGIFVTEPKWNAQNISNSSCELNKMNVKYPVPILQTSTGTTYGLLTPAHTENAVYNRARSRGFFSGNTTVGFSAITNGSYMHSSNWCFPLTGMTGGSQMLLYSGACNTINYNPQVGDLIMVQYQNPFVGNFLNPGCNSGTLDVPLNYPAPYLFYNVVSGVTSGSTATAINITVDRDLPNFNWYHLNSMFTDAISANTGCAHVIVYPAGGMLNFYGADTPIPYWSPGSLSFDNNCDVSVKDVNVWNMNINWTQWDGNTINSGTVAGVNSTTYEDVNGYGSSGYCSTKEYLGYNSDNGQTDSNTQADYYGANNVLGYEPELSGTYVRDSFGKIRTILPSEQRCIAILHYTNQTISNFYGEKFALESNYTLLNGIGEMRNFKIHMPTLMWHKKKGGTEGSGDGTGRGDECTLGQTFYVSPPGFTDSISQCQFVASVPNLDMNEPGIRYYNLWDDNLATTSGKTSLPNRVGKVWPDLQIITVDDQELVAALSYKSNRNWTLPMPKLELIPAGTNCAGSVMENGLFNGLPDAEVLHFTYMLESTSGYTSGMHCNYYNTIIGDTSSGARDVTVAFGAEFPYIRPYDNETCTYSGTGVQVDKLKVVMQKTSYGISPTPGSWVINDITSQIANHTSGAPITAGGLINSNCSFYINYDVYTGATTYTLHDYINVPLNNNQEPAVLQFGDEYFFYGNLESDIMATIYEMRYNIGISSNQFTTSTNPTWSVTDKVRITEIGLYDQSKDLMAITKLKSPQKRAGAQQFVIKIDY